MLSYVVMHINYLQNANDSRTLQFVQFFTARKISEKWKLLNFAVLRAKYFGSYISLFVETSIFIFFSSGNYEI